MVWCTKYDNDIDDKILLNTKLRSHETELLDISPIMFWCNSPNSVKVKKFVINWSWLGDWCSKQFIYDGFKDVTGSSNLILA